ncbi:MAG TPA: hypothetical protein VK689_00790, partial [Armatimonadota bacterium]|nr:hypothetical protein [Armatimonadota bacterium]
MPIVTAHESRGTFSPWPISLAIAIGLLVVGLVLLAALFSIGLSIRPANYPDIGVAVNVGSGYSLGLGLVVESSYPWGSRLALGICAFW